MNAKRRLTPVVCGLFVAALIVFPSLTAHAQSGNRNEGPPAPGSPKPGDELRPSSIRERQFRMMQMEREAGNQPLSPEEEKLALAQIGEDYKELQVVNNKMMSSAMKAAAPNYSNISQSLTDIRKRALRLKQNLGLAAADEKVEKNKHKQVQSVPELKAELLALDNSIMSFVQSPIFKNPEVVNVEVAAKARKDLGYIIEKTQLLSKDVEKLKR